MPSGKVNHKDSWGFMHIYSTCNMFTKDIKVIIIYKEYSDDEITQIVDVPGWLWSLI